MDYSDCFTEYNMTSSCVNTIPSIDLIMKWSIV